jgi:hypothetical protein
MNNDLINHLKKVRNDSFIGLCIQNILHRDDGELQGLLKELKVISMENPEIMIPIIGEQAHAILMK